MLSKEIIKMKSTKTFAKTLSSFKKKKLLELSSCEERGSTRRGGRHARGQGSLGDRFMT